MVWPTTIAIACRVKRLVIFTRNTAICGEDLGVDRVAYAHARLGATAACCTAVLCNASLGRLVTRSRTGLTHFRAKFADVSCETRLTSHKIRARLANLGAVFRRLYRSGIHTAARLQCHTAFLAFFTSFNALLHFFRNRLIRHPNPSGI
jgi:hypothetical protein